MRPYLIAVLLLLDLPVRAEDVIDGPPIVLDTTTLSNGSPTSQRWLWGAACWVTVSKGGRTRIEGEERGPCIEALDEAVRLARAEERVNRPKRRKAR